MNISGQHLDVLPIEAVTVGTVPCSVTHATATEIVCALNVPTGSPNVADLSGPVRRRNLRDAGDLTQPDIAAGPEASLPSTQVTVTMPGGVEGTSAGAFTFWPTPTITEVLPTSGPVAGGTNLIILGQHLLVPGTPTVHAAGAACDLWAAVYLSDSVLKVARCR